MIMFCQRGIADNCIGSQGMVDEPATQATVSKTSSFNYRKGLKQSGLLVMKILHVAPVS